MKFAESSKSAVYVKEYENLATSISITFNFFLLSKENIEDIYKFHLSMQIFKTKENHHTHIKSIQFTLKRLKMNQSIV